VVRRTAEIDQSLGRLSEGVRVANATGTALWLPGSPIISACAGSFRNGTPVVPSSRWARPTIVVSRPACRMRAHPRSGSMRRPPPLRRSRTRARTAHSSAGRRRTPEPSRRSLVDRHRWPPFGIGCPRRAAPHIHACHIVAGPSPPTSRPGWRPRGNPDWSPSSGRLAHTTTSVAVVGHKVNHRAPSVVRFGQGETEL